MISVSKLCSFYFPFDKETVLTKVALSQGKTEQEVQADWDKKRDEGIAMHKKIESYMIRLKHSKQGFVLPEPGIEGYCNFIKTAIEDWGYKIVGAERDIKNEQYGIRGKLDAIFEKDDHLLVIDWKSKTGHFEKESCRAPLSSFFNDKHHQHVYQLLIQSFLAEQSYNKPAALGYVVQDNANFKVEYTQSNHDLVKKSIETYRDHNGH